MSPALVVTRDIVEHTYKIGEDEVVTDVGTDVVVACWMKSSGRRLGKEKTGEMRSPLILDVELEKRGQNRTSAGDLVEV